MIQAWTIGQVGALFVAPLVAGVGLAAVSLPIAIHLLSRLRRRREPWAAMRLLQEAFRRQRARLRMERWLLLAVRCLLVALLGLALAGPVAEAWGGLAGPWAARWLGVGGGGRVIELVVDDSVGSRVRGDAVDGARAMRWDSVQDLALEVASAAQPGDRVRLWWGGGGGAEASVASGDAGAAVGFAGEFGDGELEALREAIVQRSPGYGVARLGEVLASVERSAAEGGVRPRVVALVSPWAGDGGWLGRSGSADASVVGAGGDARWLASRPGVGGGVEAGNLAVVAVKPERSVLVAEADGGWRASATARLRRWGDASSPLTRRVRVRLAGVDGTTLSQAERDVVFAAGEREAVAGVELRIEGDALEADAARGVPAVWWAELVGGGDALPADDTTASVVELRRRLTVLVLDDGAGESVAELDGLSPGQWAELALSPAGSAGVGGLTVTRRSAERELTDESLAGVDAVFVLAGDRLDDAGWSRLGRWMRDGGLVWLTPGLGESGGAALSAGVSGLGLGGMVDEAIGWPVGEDGLRGAGWRLSGEAAVPAALRSLGVEWGDLVSPVRVWRWVPVAGLDGDAWLVLAGVGQADGAGADELAGSAEPVLLRYVPVERGGVWVMGVAFDADWANLVVRPLFVPLLHEGLRAQVRPSEASGVVEERVTVGTALPGPATWEAGVGGEALSDEAEASLLLVDRPGLWRGVSPDESSGDASRVAEARWYAVGLEPGAGETAVIDADRLADWLADRGEWDWIESGSLNEAMSSGGVGGTWTWVLLWAVLALALVEAWLSRVFSHAGVTNRAGLARRVGRLMALLRHEPVSGRLSDRGRAA